jgi:hypothetical protein
MPPVSIKTPAWFDASTDVNRQILLTLTADNAPIGIWQGSQQFNIFLIFNNEIVLQL